MKSLHLEDTVFYQSQKITRLANYVYVDLEIICPLILKLKLPSCVTVRINFDYIIKDMKHIKENLLIITAIWHVSIEVNLTRGYPLVDVSASFTNLFLICKSDIASTHCIVLFIWMRFISTWFFWARQKIQGLTLCRYSFPQRQCTYSNQYIQQILFHLVNLSQ